MAILLNEIYFEKNLDTMQRMDDNSVDLIMTSPPYAQARKDTYGGIHPDTYIEWFKPIAKELYRVLSPKGSFILNVGDNTIKGETHLWTYELPIVLKREIGYKFIDTLMWHKSCSSPGQFNNRFKGAWEFLYHFAKQTDIIFNPDAVSTPMSKESLARALRNREFHVKRSRTNSGFTIGHGNVQKKVQDLAAKKLDNLTDEELEEIKSLPSNVLYMAPEFRNKNHSAVFPLPLPYFFISAYTNPGAVVYDPFIGSGTTAEASLLLGRKFIGSETVKSNVDEANKRIHYLKNSIFT